MAHHAASLGTEDLANGTFNLSLLPPPLFIRPMAGLKIAEAPINANVVAHVCVDSASNMMVVIRAGAAKMGPFYMQLTTSKAMIINLKLEASVQSGATTKIKVLEGKATFSMGTSSGTTTYYYEAPNLGGLLCGTATGGIGKTPIPFT